MRTCKFDASLRCFLVPSVFRARVSAYSVVGSGCLPELPNDMQTYRVSRMSTRRLILPFVPGHPLHPALISAPSSVLSLFPPLPSCGHAERQHQMRGIQRVWGYTCKVHLPPVLLLPSRNSRGGQRAEGGGRRAEGYLQWSHRPLRTIRATDSRTRPRATLREIYT